MNKKGIKPLVQIYLLSRYVILMCKKCSKDSGLIARFVAIQLLSEKPRTVRELSSLFSVNHSFMSSFISDLEKKGYVRKKRHKDNRFRLIELTPKGKEMAKAINQLGQTDAEGLFSNMTETEIKTLEKMLCKINKKHDFKKTLDEMIDKKGMSLP